MDLQSQQKTLEMQRGLFLIKYEASDDNRRPPTVQVSADRGSEGSVEFILPPGADTTTLWSPGAGLVVRATRNARLLLVVAATQPNGSTAARVQVVALSQDPGGLRQQAAAPPLNLTNFRVLGHVAGQGDVVVDADNWIAGPLAPSRIEGIAVQWPNMLPDLTLRYAVTFGGQRPQMGQWVEAGTFAGSRGRALPLVGATFELSGAAANGQQLVIDSVFLGSPQMRAVGQRIVLSGPTGREPLVGLRLRIDPIERAGAVRPPVAAAQPRQSDELEQDVPIREALQQVAVAAERDGRNNGSHDDAAAPKRSGRVRVFRSQSRKNLTASAAPT